MLNPNAPEYEYKQPSQRCNDPSFPFSDFSHSIHSSQSLWPFRYFHPFIQIQRPIICNNSLMDGFPTLPEPLPFLTELTVAANNSEYNGCKGGLTISPELPTNVEEIPFEVLEPKAEKTASGRHRRLRGPLPRCLPKKSLMWRVKGESEVGGGTGCRTPITSFEFDLSASGEEKRTTVMMKNIPNRYSRTMLVELLDKHCLEENQKAQRDSDSGSEPILSEYDFVYLPIDFRNQCNMGYAFINFTTSTAAIRFYKSFQNHEWKVFASKKICGVFYARIQGREALEANFQGMVFRCGSDEYLPILLSPPRDGSTSLTSPQLVGSRKVSPPK